jgi:hypothetical protein
LSGWPPLDLVTTIIFLFEQNVITNVRIWTYNLYESSGHLSPLSNKTRISSFGLLKLEIWVEYWTVSGLQDRFRLLFCCYNLNLITAILNLGLSMKVLGLCLNFPSIYTIPKSMFCNSIYDPITEWCFSLNWTNISFLSLALSLSSQFQYLNTSINSLNYEICLHSK